MRIPSDTVLLTVDLPLWGDEPTGKPALNAAALLDTWRAAGFPIVDVAAPEDDRPAAVTASLPDAFAQTDLENRLDALGCTTLVVCGAIKPDRLTATVTKAVALGYRVFVVRDACELSNVGTATDESAWPMLDSADAAHVRLVTAEQAIAAARLTAARPGWSRARART